MKLSSRFQVFFFVFIVALLSSLCFQGSRGLYDRDETRYSECAREMLITGSWLVPLRDFKPHLTKPPLTYWAIAAGLKAFGINEWGARIPNALAFSVTVLLVGLIGDKLSEQRLSPWTSLVYLTSMVPFAASNIVTTDTILVMWEVASMWAFINGFYARKKKRAHLWFAIMSFLWGMGFLTKGPAIFPVAAGAGIFWFCKRKRFQACPVSLPVIFIFLVTGLSWYLIVVNMYPWAKNLIIKEQVTGRLFSNMFHRNSAWYAPFYMYLPMIVLGSLPWCLSWATFFNRSVHIKTMHGTLCKIKEALSKDTGLLFLFLWWSVPLIIFSAASSRLPLYILPVFPPMAIATARILYKKTSTVFALRRKVFTTLVCFLVLKGISAMVPAPQNARAMYGAFSPYIKNSDDIDTISRQFLDGLAFYSGKPIEYLPDRLVTFSPRFADASWNQELKEIRKGKKEIFVLDLSKKTQVELMKKLGLKTELLTRFYAYGLFKVSSKGTWYDLPSLAYWCPKKTGQDRETTFCHSCT